jgi:hypothetical protein
MRTSVFILGRGCLATAAGLAVLLAAGNSLAVISYQLPEVSVPANTSGPTTGTFDVKVSAAPGDLPKLIGAFNLDFTVGSNLVTLAPPQASATSLIPIVNPLLSDPGPPLDPFIKNFSPNGQTIRVGHDVMTDQPLMTEKNLVTVKFTIPAGTTGTFPLSFGVAQNNVLVEGGTANPIPLILTDIGQITITPAAPVGVPGDYNNNNVVDAADYVVWRNNLGTSFALPNEVSGVTPGTVTAEDYAAWRARFGRTSGSGAALGFAAAVPEPTSLSFMLIISLVPAVLTHRSGRRDRVCRPEN